MDNKQLEEELNKVVRSIVEIKVQIVALTGILQSQQSTISVLIQNATDKRINK